jgi:hypothetical protein
VAWEYTGYKDTTITNSYNNCQNFDSGTTACQRSETGYNVVIPTLPTILSQIFGAEIFLVQEQRRTAVESYVKCTDNLKLVVTNSKFNSHLLTPDGARFDIGSTDFTGDRCLIVARACNGDEAAILIVNKDTGANRETFFIGYYDGQFTDLTELVLAEGCSLSSATAYTSNLKNFAPISATNCS